MAELALEATAKRLMQAIHDVSTGHVDSEYTRGTILDEAESLNSDLIIMGHKGKGAVDHFLLGSLSNRVVYHDPCLVWLVR